MAVNPDDYDNDGVEDDGNDDDDPTLLSIKRRGVKSP